MRNVSEEQQHLLESPGSVRDVSEEQEAVRDVSEEQHTSEDLKRFLDSVQILSR